ncbi:metallophosphoesterase [Edaphobacter aggregans]|uniref:metallophosphoesterase n=1 Tax=Edaphobacter aggregans TaxID=570835 RepID=UPI000556CDD2|nr:metallophosphoesterase [Edaphobacter aggregans]
MNEFLSRRRFLRQSFAFSALTALGSLPSLAKLPSPHPGASHWLMVGDWGYENFTAQKAVAAAMQRYVHEHSLKTDALLMLGDNWYGPLPGGVASPRWTKQFEEMYPVGVFDCPAYAVLGNHDYQRMPESKVDAELAYAKKGGTRWTLPSRWYRFEFPAATPLVTVLALDSNVFHPMSDRAKRENFTLTPEEQAEQLRWLKAELEKLRQTPYLIVMAHHPIYSNGPHGDHATLIAEWEPLLREHKAHLYLAGHDHDMQHLEFDGHPTSFVLSGGGGADLYTLKIEEAQRGPYAAKVYGFSHLQIAPDKLTLLHLDTSGHVIHGFTKTPSGEVQMLS